MKNREGVKVNEMRRRMPIFAGFWLYIYIYTKGSGPVNPSPNWPRTVTRTVRQERGGNPEGGGKKMAIVDIV